MEVTIRPMQENDLEPLCDLLADPAVMRYLEPPYTRAQAAAFLKRAGLCDPPLILAAEADGRFVGYVIFHDYDETALEIGWVLFPDCWGKGIASRLTGLMIERGRETGKALVIECAPEQTASGRLALKYGFEYEGRSDGLDVYRRNP